MTPEEQHVAIAQIHLKLKAEEIHSVTGRGLVYGIRTEAGLVERRIPNYTGDLNAMHEAEKVLTWKQRDAYRELLTEAEQGAGRNILHATAAQRAEAFLRAIGKWYP